MRRFGRVGRAHVTRSLQVFTAVVLVAAGMSYPTIFASSLPTTAFEIADANIVDGAAPAPDWGALFTSSGGPNVVAGVDATSFVADLMNADALPSPPCDAGKKGDLTVFAGAGGEKNFDPFSTWTYQSGSSPPSSNDLTNVYAASAKDSGDTIFYFAQERSNTNGDSHIDFEFTRQSVGLVQDVKNGVPQTDSSGCPLGHFSGARSVGDILISVEYSSGGTDGSAEVRVWDGDSYEQPLKPAPNPTNAVWTFAEMVAANVLNITTNLAPIACGAWNCRDETGAPTATLATNAFVEGYINVSDILPVVGCFSSFNAKTRSSTSWTSSLKDFTLGSFNTCNANISITPSGVNAVGTNHTFTATVNTNDTGTYAPKQGILVTGTTSFGSFVGGNTCTTDGSGQCTLTVTSSTAGTSTVNVSATVPLASGASVFRSTATASGPGGSGPATKNWVDAYIKVTPDDVNPVGEAHTFTFEYGVLGGGAAGLTVATPTITPAITPAPATTPVSTCATPTKVAGQNVWTCTVTINSATTGVFTATAAGSTTVTMAGGTPSSATLTRSTTSASTHGPDGNTGATKTYVDARISITPDGLNQVAVASANINDPHTITATVENKIGNGLWVPAPLNTLVTFTLGAGSAGGFVAGNTCQTNAAGQCNVQINSTSAGTTTVSASTTVTTSTTPAVALARTSGTITKHWVDAAIKILQTDTNEINDDHEFTITVTPIKPAAVAVDSVVITPSVSPNTTNSTTCGATTPVVGGVAICTYTVNSASAGIFNVDATTTVTYSWNGFTQAVARSTTGYAGPNGNDGATKTFVDARVSLGDDGVNKVGDAHTVTGFAELNDGTGWKPAAGKTIIFAETSDTATSGFVGGTNTCVAGTDGKCTVQINSLTPGVTWIKATTTYAVGGVTMTRTSATTATDPANLRKEWVSAKISITPSEVNEVGDAHVFNILVTATAASAGIVIATPTSLVSPGGALTTNTLACDATVQSAGTGATRSCTLTINSATAGVFTANASATVTIGGTEVFNLTTDGQGENSGAAVKTYVDASIAIANDGVNEVNDPHTVTATVKQNSGTGGFVAAEGKTVTFTETGPGDIPVSCVTAADGTCSVQLTSSAAGVSTVHAAVTLSVLGESITRETNTAINTAAGGSGDLTKRWIDGAISITPNDVNPVGAPHTFTITATSIASGAGTPAYVITPSVTPAPTSSSNTCATPVITNGSATATCTVTINSNAPGVFTANASVKITIGGVEIVRNTNPGDLISAGIGGSGPATKRYVDANIQITPDGINQVGEPHVVTGHVNINDGSGNGATNAPAGTTISFTKVGDGPGTLSASSCTTIGTTGSCAVTLSSTEVGTTILQASSTVSVNGVDLTITTNGAGANSDNVEKDWVDGLIKVTPNDVNPVNEAHTFNVEYTVLAPAGTVVVLDSLTADVARNPGTEGTCTPVQSGNTWTCTVTINSAVTGVFDIDATGSATVTDPTIPGASKIVTRSTSGNAGPGGNTGATKTYVDARISVTPGGLNAVDDAHTVTATVETKNGIGAWVKAPAGTTVTFDRTGAGGFSGPGICDTTGTTGSCSIAIVAASAGTTVVGASATVTVDTVTITRSTGTAVNTAAGGSGPITKEWVDGSIKVERDATNAVNDDHPFTITAYAHLPAGSSDETVTFNSITPSVDPTPDLGVVSTCATPTVAADGLSATCTYTINSSVADVFKVDAVASITIDNPTYDAVTFNRSTTGDFGPNGSDGAEKTYVDAAVAIGPDGVNAIGDDHTVTGTATKNSGTGGWVAAQGETITFAITSGPGTLSAATCQAGANGTCSVTLHSDAAGVTWVSASTQYAVGGVTLSRTTAVSGATDEDNLRKEWVKANIAITPTAVNTVNEPHTFTILVGAESSAANIAIGLVTASAVPTPDSSNLNCAAPTGTSGAVTRTCSLTINDSTAGIHTATASVSVNIGGVVFDLTTNAEDGNSGPATKTYVDVRIKLAKDGVNEVGDPHPVTATVEVNDGQGWVPAPAGVTVNLTETGPGSIPTTCTTTADSVGTCTVDLTSTTAGVSTVHASVTTTVLGEIITRETSTALNTAAGGSGDLTKRWVDGFVTITPDGVNEVGDAHTFTVTATAIPSGAGAPTFVVAPSVTPAPSTMTTTCAKPTVSGDTATCSVTVNSSTTGTFTANVTATMAVGGVTLTRSTNTTVAPAGPGGSGPSRKVYVDAFITIAETAVNPLNVPHTFTITVTSIPSGASPVVFGAITTTLSPVPGSVSSTCATPVVNGNKATCTLTINSSVAGVFVANASANLTIGGTALVRSTNSSVATAGPGGSGPATKTYEVLEVLDSVVVRPAPAASAPMLPRTGAEVLRLLSIAVLLLVTGASLVVLVRRRRSETA